jgi:hypothetical protein
VKGTRRRRSRTQAKKWERVPKAAIRRLRWRVQLQRKRKRKKRRLLRQWQLRAVTLRKRMLEQM